MSHIMVIDDDPLFATLVRRRLESEGHSVTYNKGACGALTTARQSCPDVILVDVQMPEIDGPKLVGFLRDRGFGTPRILLMSSIAEHDLRSAASSYGAHGYICKGWGLDAIASRVRD